MRLSPFDLKEITRQDLRVRAYRENQWRDKEGFNPLEMAALTCIAGACIALMALMGLLVLNLKYGNDVIRFFDWIDKSANDLINILACIFS